MMCFVPRSDAAVLPAAADDAALVRRIAAGDRLALDAAYRAHSAAVHRYLLAIGATAAAAADALHEAFVVLASRPSSFDAQRGRLPAWLAGIARHALLLHWREQRREAALGDESIDVEAPGDQAEPASPEQLLVSRQSSTAVWAAIRALPFAQREALVLVDLQERPYAEAAQIAGIGVDRLRSRLHRARLRLAERLGKEG
jgi:RNA polymerase sigma-70 factor (ECF subfamily)